jgi:hypothetical protein
MLGQQRPKKTFGSFIEAMEYFSDESRSDELITLSGTDSTPVGSPHTPGQFSILAMLTAAIDNKSITINSQAQSKSATACVTMPGRADEPIETSPHSSFGLS